MYKCIINYPDITVLNFMENAIGLKRVKTFCSILYFITAIFDLVALLL